MIPVIIPTYKGEKRLPKVLAALDSQGVAIKTFIRDNNVNGVYYTRAMNEGMLEYAFREDIHFVLLLCDDVYLKPGCLIELLNLAHQKPKAGIISPVQKNANGQIVWSASERSWPAGCHFTQEIAKEPYQTPWASGAVMLVRTAMIKEIGLMDKNMRFICSDADYSFRARLQGYECWVNPEAEVEHEFGGSAKSDKELDKIKTEDALYFNRKWLSGGLFRTLEANPSRITFMAMIEEEVKLQASLERFGASLS